MTASDLFAECGYSGTTVKDIVECADISTGTFYFYFKSKESLFEQIYDDFIRLLDKTSEYATANCENLIEGFCRSKTSELWIFQKYRQAAKLMMVEAVASNPAFEKKRAELYKRSNQRIEAIFNQLHSLGQLLEYDSKTYAIICNGTMYNVIVDLLQGGIEGKITDYAYPITIYNLNAFQLSYDKSIVSGYIEKMISDMELFDTSIWGRVISE